MRERKNGVDPRYYNKAHLAKKIAGMSKIGRFLYCIGAGDIYLDYQVTEFAWRLWHPIGLVMYGVERVFHQLSNGTFIKWVPERHYANSYTNARSYRHAPEVYCSKDWE